jgi:hypothetical protein
VITLATNAFSGNADAAAEIRRIADLVESGEVRDIVFAYDHRGEKAFTKYGLWDDQWRLLAALEYAKSAVTKGCCA